MKAMYSEPMTKVIMVNVNAPICTTQIEEESEKTPDIVPPTETPMF